MQLFIQKQPGRRAAMIDAIDQQETAEILRLARKVPVQCFAEQRDSGMNSTTFDHLGTSTVVLSVTVVRRILALSRPFCKSAAEGKKEILEKLGFKVDHIFLDENGDNRISFGSKTLFQVVCYQRSERSLCVALEWECDLAPYQQSTLPEPGPPTQWSCQHTISRHHRS